MALIDTVTDYLGSTSWDAAAIASALASEQRAQRRRCRIPAARVVTGQVVDGSAVVTIDTTTDTTDTFGDLDDNAAVTGTGIPADTTVSSVDSASQVTLSAAATADGTDVSLTLTPDLSDLTEALCRRVAHNLALRNLPLGVQASVTEAAIAQTRVGGTDAEVSRLEAPFRKLAVG